MPLYATVESPGAEAASEMPVADSLSRAQELFGSMADVLKSPEHQSAPPEIQAENLNRIQSVIEDELPAIEQGLPPEAFKKLRGGVTDVLNAAWYETNRKGSAPKPPKAEGAWDTFTRELSSGFEPAIAAGGAQIATNAALAEASPFVSVPAGVIAAGAAATAVEKVKQSADPEGYAANEQQRAINADQHGVASGVASTVNFLLSIGRGGGKIVKDSAGKVLGRAFTEAGEKELLKAAAKGAAYKPRALERALAGAASFAGGSAAQAAPEKYVKGNKDISVLDEVLKGSLAGATMSAVPWKTPKTVEGFVPVAKQIIAESGIRGTTDAAILHLSAALYDLAVNGKGIDFAKLSKESLGSIPAFIAQNAIMHGVHRVAAKHRVAEQSAAAAAQPHITAAAVAEAAAKESAATGFTETAKAEEVSAELHRKAAEVAVREAYEAEMQPAEESPKPSAEGGETLPAQPEPAAPVAAEKPTPKTFKRKARDLPPASGRSDVIDFLISDVGKLRSRGTAFDIQMKQRGQLTRDAEGTNFFKLVSRRVGGEYDDLSFPERLHAAIVAKRGSGVSIDEAAQMLFEANLIKDPSPDTMFSAIRSAYEARLSAEHEGKAMQESADDAKQQKENFTADAAKKKKGTQRISADELTVGDVVEVNGEKLKVIATHGFDVTLEDGDKYGIQDVDAGDVIYGKLTENELVGPKFSPQTAPREDAAPKPQPAAGGSAPKAAAGEGERDAGSASRAGAAKADAKDELTPPKLRPGEKVGEMFQGEDQPFNLAGEKGTDFDKIAAEKAKAEASAAEAKAKFDKEQQSLFAAPKGIAEKSVEKATQDELTDSERNVAAKILGHDEWTPESAKTFRESFADWFSGAKKFGGKIVEFFNRVLDAVHRGVLSISMILSPYADGTRRGRDITIPSPKAPEMEAMNFELPLESRQNSHTRDVPFVIPKPAEMKFRAEKAVISPKISAPTFRKTADFGDTAASANVRRMADWIVERDNNTGRPFVIADKANGLIYVFRKDGELNHRAPALFGKELGDLSGGRLALEGGKKVTPSGRFEMVPDVDPEGELGSTLDLAGSEIGGSSIAIHRLYLGDPKEQRQQRLASNDPTQRRISYGCINVSAELMEKVMNPTFGGETGGAIYILPETKRGAETFVGFKASGVVEELFSILPVAPAKSIGKEAVERAVKAAAKPFLGAMPVVVVESGDAFPQSIKDDAAARGITDLNRVRGAVVSGKIYVNAKAVESPQQAVETFYHESISHQGVDALLEKLRPGTAKELEARLKKDFPQEFKEVTDTYRPSETVSETMAKIAEKLGPSMSAEKRSLWNKIVDWLRVKLVKLGWKSVSRADVEALLRRAIADLKRQPLTEPQTPVSELSGNALLDEARQSIRDNESSAATPGAGAVSRVAEDDPKLSIAPEPRVTSTKNAVVDEEDRLRPLNPGESGAAAIPDALKTIAKFTKPIADTIRGVRKNRTSRDLEETGTTDEATQVVGARSFVPWHVKDILHETFGDRITDEPFVTTVGETLRDSNIVGGYDDLKTEAAALEQKPNPTHADMEQLADLHNRITEIEAAQDIPLLRKSVDMSAKIAGVPEAIERFRNATETEQNAMYNKLAALDPATPRETRGYRFGARVNLLPANEEAKLADFLDTEKPMPEMRSSSYRNPDVKRDKFNRRAAYTGRYSGSLKNMMLNSYGSRIPQVTKLRLYNKLVENGHAVWLEPGDTKPDTLGGEETAVLNLKVPVENKGKSTQQIRNLAVQKSKWETIRRIIDTDMRPQQSNILKAMTFVQVFGIADATAHTKNQLSVVSKALSLSGGWRAVAARFPILSSILSGTEIFKVWREISAGGAGITKEIAALAKNGMLRNSGPKQEGWKRFLPTSLIHNLLQNNDTAARIIASRTYDQLVKSAFKAEDTLEGKRAFVMEIGEYNRRMMQKMEADMRDSGFSPFIVAGRTFNRFARKLLFGEVGFKSTDPAAALKARAAMFAMPIAVALSAVIANLMLSGTMTGRKGTPFGAIDLGKDKDDERGGRKVIDLFQITGLRRAFRAFGLNSILEGNGMGAAIDEATATAAHPFIGPGAGFIYETLTGNRLDLRQGWHTTTSARHYENGVQQKLENMRSALQHLNALGYETLAKPLIAKPALAMAGMEMPPDKGYGAESNAALWKAPASAFGYREIRSPAMNLASEINKQRIPSMPPNEQQHEASVAKAHAKLMASKGNTEELRQLIRDKVITPAQARTAIDRSKLPPIVNSTYSFTVEQMQKVYDAADASEKKQLEPYLRRKKQNAHKR